jgi:uncharacterized protein
LNKKNRKNLNIFLVFVMMLSLFLPNFSQSALALVEKTETFATSALTTSYADGTFKGIDDITWTYTGSRNEDIYPIDGKGLMFRGEIGKYIESSEIPGGISSFSVDLKKAFTGIGNRQVEVFINGVSIGKSEAFDDANVHTFSVEQLNITGAFKIKITNVQAKQVVIDNISWTSNDGNTPAPTKVANVTASVPTSTVVAAGTKVTLSTTTPDAKIYYTTDGTTEPTASSTEYTAPIEISADTIIKAVAVKSPLENSDVATFTYTLLVEKTIAEVRATAYPTTVKTTGTVTHVAGKTVYMQDATAGIVVFGNADVPVKIGDNITVKGKLVDFRTLLEIEVNIADVVINSQGQAPAAEVLKAAEINESKEGKLVKIKKVTINSYSGGNYIATDEFGGEVQLRPADINLLKLNTTYDEITAVVGSFNDIYQLIPRNVDDIIQDVTKAQPVKATPGSGMIKAGDAVTLTTNTTDATIHYTTDGSNPTTASAVYTQPIIISQATTVKAIAVKSGLSNSVVSTFDYGIQEGVIRIHDIQGARHSSLYNGSNVTDVEGVVTYVDTTSAFYIQDINPDTDVRTSEGIYVSKTSHGVAVGDLVKVSGKVTEFYGDGYAEKAVTDLSSTRIEATTITKNGTHALPAPVKLGVDRIAPTSLIEDDSFGSFDAETDGLDFWESLEGMYVQLKDAKVIAPQRYGDVWVVPGTVATNTSAGGLRISATDYNPEKISLDFNDENFIAKMGDSFPGEIHGVISYGYSNYKVLTQKSALPTLVEGPLQREVATFTKADDKLTIASYNVENFSANTANTPDEKVTKLAQAIVANMKTPDIIGLVEVQDNNGETNDGTVDATQSAQKLIDKVIALGGPAYQFTNINPVDGRDGGAPGGNIRVGFLYNPLRVTLTQGVPVGDSTTAVGFANGKLTVNPGRIDPTNPAFNSSRKPLAAQFDFQGKSVIVVANHFNSKGGDQALFGKNQPPVLGSEVQRLKIAEIVNGFVKDVKQKDPHANVVLLGDFNDFEFTPALAKLKGQELTNMIDLVDEDDRYTYNYQGNAQVLDHILVSKNMEANTAVDIVHINSSFMEHHGRASDHDPVIIQTKLTSAPVEVVPAVPAPANTKVYNLKGFKTKKIMVANQAANITVDINSEIREGITLKGSYVKLQGEGLKNTVIIIAPNHPGAYIDLSGVEVKEVIIENANISQIRGAENVQKWTVSDDVDTSNIKVTNVSGEVFPSPFFPQAPLIR